METLPTSVNTPRTNSAAAGAPIRSPENPCAIAPFHDHDQSIRVVSSLARQSLEVLNGHRSIQTVAPFLMIEELRKLQRRAKLISEHRKEKGIRVSPRIAVGGTHICRVNESVVETTCIVRDSIRPRFICMRWELRRGNWRVVELNFG